MNYFENIVVIVPFDFSEPSKKAVDQTIAWADDSTTVHVIHVVEPSWPFPIAMDLSTPIPPTFDSENRDILFKRLKELYGKTQPNLKIHCVIGDPGSEITELATRENARLIVMPSHGRTGISRLLLGSVAERVLRMASCPVLILRGESFDGNQEKQSPESATASGA